MSKKCNKIKEHFNKQLADQDKWTTPKGVVPDYPNITRDDVLNCTGLCGPGMYIDIDTSNNTPTGTCVPCPPDYDSDTDNRGGGISQCADGTDSWYENQLDTNFLKGDRRWYKKEIWNQFEPENVENLNDTSKSYSNVVCSTALNAVNGDGVKQKVNDINAAIPDANMTNNGFIEACEILDGYLSIEQPMSDAEIKQLIGTKNKIKNSSGKLVDGKDLDMDKIRKEIHSKRGENIPIIQEVMNTWSTNYTKNFLEPEPPLDPKDIPEGYGLGDFNWSPSSTYTKKHIVLSEVYDYINDTNVEKKSKNPVTGINFGSIFKDMKLNTDFETCMDTVLDMNFKNRTYCDNKTPEELDGDISKLQSIQGLQNCHLDYIEDRLKTIATLQVNDVDECMKHYNLTETFDCDESISDKMLKIAYLIFHIVGFDNIDLSKIKEGTPEYVHLRTIIDRLTPYIKPSIKKIIDISKYYEEETCGKQSVTTHMLDTIYQDFFDMSVNNKIDISQITLIPDNIKYGNMNDLGKLIIWIVSLSFAFYMFMRAISLLG